MTPAAKKRRKMDELCDRIYENLETDHENIEFDLRALRLMEILSNKGISLRRKSREELASELPYHVQAPWHLPWPVDA